MTEWKQIAYFNYEVSERGDIRSNKFKRLLTLNIDKDGYKYIGLRKLGDRKKYWFRIHRLVANAFCDIPESETQTDVDHVDRNILNNHFTNLRWVTKAENNANRQNIAWSTNKTTGELYITKYSNGYIVRINRSDLKHKSWHKTIEDAICCRNSFVEGAVVSSGTKFSLCIS